MTVINYNTFRAAVFGWASNHYGRFQHFYPLDGGWEYWVQAEVAAHIFTLNNTYELLRERNIYQNTQKADWLLNSLTGGNARIAVELKCQRGADLSGSGFARGIAADIRKLEAGNLPRGVTRVVVGIYYSQGPHNWVRNNFVCNRHNRQTYGNNYGVFVFTRQNDGRYG